MDVPQIQITVDNFATIPVGIFLVWVVMHLIDRAYPTLTSRQKVYVQVCIALAWAVTAGVVFLSGDWRMRAQQVIVMLFSVASGQTFIYEGLKKVAPAMFDSSSPEPTTPVVPVAPVEPAPVSTPASGVTEAQRAFAPYPEQGQPDGRI